MSIRIGDLRFLHGSLLPTCTAVMDKRFVGYRSLQFMESGAVEVTYGQRTHRLNGRWVWPHHPGPRIRLHGTDGGSWHHRYLAVSGSLVDAWADEGLWPLAPQPVAPDLDLGRSFDACLALFRDGHRMRHRRAVNQLEDMLLLLAESRGADEQAPWLARAQHLLASHESFHADIPDIAKSCTMPTSTFRRRFALATGMSPQAWALHARMAKARELLITTSSSVSRIAADLGYDDPAFFGRQFRRHAGRSPAAWRREFC